MEILYISLLVLAFIFISCMFIAVYICHECARINIRIDDLCAKQRTIFKNHLLSLMSQMEESKASALMFEEYDVACSIQKKIESIKKDLKDYEA